MTLSERNKGRTWYTNGINNKFTYPGTQPNGFYLGKVGQKGSHKSYDIYTNGVDNIHIYEGYDIPIGYWKGKTPKSKPSLGKSWYNNGIEERYLSKCPINWSKGRLPVKESTKIKLSKASRIYQIKRHQDIINKYLPEVYELITSDRLKELILSLPKSERYQKKIHEKILEMYPNSKLPCISFGRYLWKYADLLSTAPSSRTSHYETDIIEYLRLIRVDNIIQSYRPKWLRFDTKVNKELDIYLPDYNLAIEFNGLWSHSDLNMNYHSNKSKLCRDRGIQLIHIYEHEWIKDEAKIKNYLLSLINRVKILNKLTIFKFDKNNFNVVNNFINKYSFDHLNYDIAYGLRDNDRLYAVMTFRLINENAYEVFICKSYNYDVDNYLHLILDKFKVDSNPNKLIYYCNYSKFNDKDITNLNFKFDSESINRKFVNYNLDEIDYSENLVEDCKSKGYYLVTDAGVGKYIYDDILNNDKTRRFRKL